MGVLLHVALKYDSRVSELGYSKMGVLLHVALLHVLLHGTPTWVSLKTWVSFENAATHSDFERYRPVGLSFGESFFLPAILNRSAVPKSRMAIPAAN